MANYISDVFGMTTMRRFAREWVADYPSITRMSEAMAGQRRMGSEATVTNYVKAVKKFCVFLAVSDPEVLLEKFQRGKLDARTSVDGYIDHALED